MQLLKSQEIGIGKQPCLAQNGKLAKLYLFDIIATSRAIFLQEKTEMKGK